MAVDFVRGSFLLDVALVHDDDPRGHGHRFGLVVGDVDCRSLQLVHEADDLAPHLDPELGVQVRQGLVHEIEGAFFHDGPPEGDALHLAAAQLPRVAVEVGPKGKEAGGFEDLLLYLLFLCPFYPQRKADVVVDVELGVEGIVLEDHGEVPLAGREVIGELPVDIEFPFGHVLEAGDHS